MREVIIEDIRTRIPLGSKEGVFIRIREGGRNIGKLWIGKAKVRWGRGSVPYGNAKVVSMKAFIDFLDNL